MIKKLDKLIIRAFIGPFIATFFIAVFVLVMQFFWLYIDDLVGKGLGFFMVMRLAAYFAATIVPLALPLAVLLSSIMTFGNLGETFELVAIKSSGISLLRFMRPLFIVSIFIAGVSFLFNNNIIPVANLKFNTLKYDIVVSKPAFDIKEGVFYDKLDGYIIKLGKKDADGSTIHDIVIYEKGSGFQDNLLIAQDGKMSITADKKFMLFDLIKGWRYQERGTTANGPSDLVRLNFKSYKKVFDLGSFKLNKTSDSAFKDNYRMLSLRQLGVIIDSLQKTNKEQDKKSRKEVLNYIAFARLMDTVYTFPRISPNLKMSSFNKLIPDSTVQKVNEAAIANITSLKNVVEFSATDKDSRVNNLRLNLTEWHRKFSLAFACIVLFLIGAPLGSIIRKGGLGLPLVFAIIFFITFHLFNTFGEKLVKEGILSAFVGMWLASIALLPVGLFLIYKAMHDSQLFNKEMYYRLYKSIRNRLKKKKEMV
ncbi:MAG TPA: LptF/LptG family permease [Chitinophagaceae bacterium]|nr:LptF/LptG family permease [Chitinophagaceae bacterium]